MNENSTDQALQAAQQILQQTLGSSLLALFVYGSLVRDNHQPGQSDINLLAVTTDEKSIHELRQAFLTFWQEHGAVLRRPPRVLSQTALGRHLSLNPVFAAHLQQHSKRLTGSFELPAAPQIKAAETTAFWAASARQASIVLAEKLLEPDQVDDARRKIGSLARQISGEPVDLGATPAELFAQIQQELAGKMAALPEEDHSVAPVDGAPDLLPNLQAIYEITNRVILVLPELTADQIRATNWQQVAQRFTGHYEAMMITTADQFRLGARYQETAELRLRTFNHAWGRPILDNIEVPLWRLLRDLARLPDEILVNGLLPAYLVAEDDHLSNIVHAFSNKLLNVQLRHELLHRLLQMERVVPPNPLPDHDTPDPQRIDAIEAQLDWWTEHYAVQMTAEQTDNS